MLDEYYVVAVRGKLTPPLNGERNRWEHRAALEFQGTDVDEPHLAVGWGQEVDPGLQFVHGHEFAHRCQADGEIGEDVVDSFDADREANEPGCDTGGELLFGGELRVCRRGGVDHE